MKLYNSSLMFNMNLPEGGQPSWGTELGQGEGYKFNFDDSGEFLTGMLYNSIDNISSVWCPLGKGGNRQTDYEYVVASLFNKVYVNDIKIDNAQFVLLIVKQINSESGNHIGRRSLKYSPRIKLNDIEINQDCFDKIKCKFNLSDDAAWFVDEIIIKNQDELHLITYICDKSSSLDFASTEDRKKYIDNIINHSNLKVFDGFQQWLTSKKNPDYTGKEKYTKYDYSLKRLINLMYEKKIIQSNDLNNLNVEWYENIKNEYFIHDEIIDFDKTKNQNQAGIASLKKYILYIQYLNNLKDHPTIGYNKIFYGTPGCGKSYYVENVLIPNLGILTTDELKDKKLKKEYVVRTTFYQDYSNTDFVGQILPRIIDGDVSYEFTPGPFALALKNALKHSDEPTMLIIEEINRGNAASIFGDIFQLLDRDKDGRSEYEITNVNLQKFIKDELGIDLPSIYIPSNLYIIGTMNTSDQNVFTLDTAFKRRWKFEKIKNEFNGKAHDNWYVPGTDTTWKDLVLAINEYIISNADEFMNEDKQIGVYFVDENGLVEDKVDVKNPKKVKEFSYKVLEYLWDDVARFTEKSKWFNPDIKTLDQLIETYIEKANENKALEVFGKDLNELFNKKHN